MHHEQQFCEIILNLGQWFRMRRCLKDFLSGALEFLLFDRAEPFMQFLRGHHGEHSCEVIWNLDQWMLFTRSLAAPFVQLTGTICAILVEGIMRNYSVRLL